MTSFHDHKRYVVRLWCALAEILNGLLKAIRDRITAGAGIPLNNLP